MTGRTDSTPTILGILMVVFILFVIGSGLGLFAAWWPMGQHHFWLGSLFEGPGWIRFGPVFGLFGFGAILQFALAVWVGLDARRRGMNGLLWGLMVLFTFVVGALVYLIVAHSSPGAREERAGPDITPTPTGTCGGCGKSVEPSFRVCPYCGHELASRCPGCDRPTTAGWKVCPYCAAAL